MSKLAPIATAAILISTFTAGCGTTHAATTGISNQAPKSASSPVGHTVGSGATNATDATNVTNATNATAGEPNTGHPKSEKTRVIKAPDAQSLTAASMEKIAKRLITRYIQSYNDKTIAAFKADAQKIFYPGLANFVIASARSGTDYNHPVKSHNVTIAGVEAPNVQTFVAQATLTLDYQDGTSETLHYQFAFAPNDKGTWTIQSMRGT